MKNMSTTKDKRTALRRVGKVWSHMQKTPCSAWRPTIGRDLKNMELFPEKQGVSAVYQAPQPLGPALRDKPPKCKTNGDYVQETIALRRIENLFLKCLYADSVTVGPVQKQQLKNAWPYVNVSQLLILKWVLKRGRNLSGLSPGMETLAGGIFAITCYLANANAGRCHLAISL